MSKRPAKRGPTVLMKAEEDRRSDYYAHKSHALDCPWVGGGKVENYVEVPVSQVPASTGRCRRCGRWPLGVRESPRCVDTRVGGLVTPRGASRRPAAVLTLAGDGCPDFATVCRSRCS